jgi:hypothetical protein
MATEQEKLLLTLLEASEDLAKEYEKELKIRKTYCEVPDFSESIIHFN